MGRTVIISVSDCKRAKSTFFCLNGDGWTTCDFTSFSTVFVISGRWMDDNERLCAMEPRLRLKRYPLQAGIEPGTARHKWGEK